MRDGIERHRVGQVGKPCVDAILLVHRHFVIFQIEADIFAFKLSFENAMAEDVVLGHAVGGNSFQSREEIIVLFVAALVLYYPVSALFTIGVYLSFVARPLGFVFGVISLRLLCLALIVLTPDLKGDKKDAV